MHYKYPLAAPDCYPSAKPTKLMVWYKYLPKQATVAAFCTEGKWPRGLELWPECLNTEFSWLPVNMLHQEVCTVNIDVARKKDTWHIEVTYPTSWRRSMAKQRSRSWVVRKPHKRHARADGRTKITVFGKPTRADQLDRNLGGTKSEEESPSQLSGGLRPPPRCHKRSNWSPTTSFPCTSCSFFIMAKTAAGGIAVNHWSRLLVNRQRGNSFTTGLRVAFTAQRPWRHSLFQRFNGAEIQLLEFQTKRWKCRWQVKTIGRA